MKVKSNKNHINTIKNSYIINYTANDSGEPRRTKVDPNLVGRNIPILTLSNFYSSLSFVAFCSSNYPTFIEILF